jgi:hypothetical protein
VSSTATATARIVQPTESTGDNLARRNGGWVAGKRA